MTGARSGGSRLAPLPCRDDFGDPGASLPPRDDTACRRLVDPEGIAGLDGAAVRFAPPLSQGWGRAALSYGPWNRRDGLTFAAYLLNGHNTAQVEQLPDSLMSRFDRWLRACGRESRRARVRAWLRSGRVRRTLRAFRWWWTLRREQRSVPRLDENLAVGWYAQPVPLDPVGAGAGFVMHATGGENGELWVRAGGVSQAVLRAVPDIPLALVVVLRGRGALYCAGATPAGCGLPAYPCVRPLAIDTQSDETLVNGVVAPAAWGQIGFRIDTRVHAIHVAAPAGFGAWCGPAVAADRLSCDAGRSDGDLQAERGGAWEPSGEVFRRGPSGVVAGGPGAWLLRPAADEGIGLVHVLVSNLGEGGAGILARAVDADNCVRVTLGQHSCVVHEIAQGLATLLAEATDLQAARGAERALQLSLDGACLSVAVDGIPVLEAVTTRAPREVEGVGLHAAQAEATFRDFEAQPARLFLPPELCAEALPVPAGTVELAADAFTGPAQPLEGTTTSSGGLVWSRRMGSGRIELTGDGAAGVVATAREPNPGRTAFTVPWRSTGLADLAMTMTIPGTGPGDWHKPRGGFLFWQDDDNFLIVSLWRGDEYPGASLSSFFTFRGFEDIYDAVWSNIGRRAWYGEQVRLRVAFDGRVFLAELDGQPVLYRRLTDFYPDAPPLMIREVGIVANWEWGNDTGTVFRDFRARGTDLSP